MSVRETVDDLRNDLNQVRRDLAALTGELAGLAQVGTQEAKDRLFSRIAALQSQAAVLQERLRERLGEGVDRLDEQIRANPYHAVVVAGVVGVALAWLVTRRCDR